MCVAADESPLDIKKYIGIKAQDFSTRLNINI